MKAVGLSVSLLLAGNAFSQEKGSYDQQITKALTELPKIFKSHPDSLCLLAEMTDLEHPRLKSLDKELGVEEGVSYGVTWILCNDIQRAKEYKEDFQKMAQRVLDVWTEARRRLDKSHGEGNWTSDDFDALSRKLFDEEWGSKD
ncbi:MAG: hypothetical protein K9M51_02190 [Candidatus Gracilibacteria bacterium]|nr:hypothetical protein [Candidatus Gracilibacteria bacterium]